MECEYSYERNNLQSAMRREIVISKFICILLLAPVQFGCRRSIYVVPRLNIESENPLGITPDDESFVKEVNETLERGGELTPEQMARAKEIKKRLMQDAEPPKPSD